MFKNYIVLTSILTLALSVSVGNETQATSLEKEPNKVGRILPGAITNCNSPGLPHQSLQKTQEEMKDLVSILPNEILFYIGMYLNNISLLTFRLVDHRCMQIVESVCSVRNAKTPLSLLAKKSSCPHTLPTYYVLFLKKAEHYRFRILV